MFEWIVNLWVVKNVTYILARIPLKCRRISTCDFQISSTNRYCRESLFYNEEPFPVGLRLVFAFLQSAKIYLDYLEFYFSMFMCSYHVNQIRVQNTHVCITSFYATCRQYIYLNQVALSTVLSNRPQYWFEIYMLWKCCLQCIIEHEMFYQQWKDSKLSAYQCYLLILNDVLIIQLPAETSWPYLNCLKTNTSLVFQLSHWCFWYVPSLKYSIVRPLHPQCFSTAEIINDLSTLEIKVMKVLRQL